jgi:hypothetical protein
MPYQVHFEMPGGKAVILEAFDSFHDAQSYATQKARELRPVLVAIREVDRELAERPH